jgi:hypothetical protein
MHLIHKAMKPTFIILIIILGSNLYGQTDSLEKAIYYKMLVSKDIKQEEFSKTWTKWNQTLKETGKYPDLPLDQKGDVRYSFTSSFTDLSKEILFTRTLEWLAINYGLIPSYLYSNLADGKIIFRNSVNISSVNSCTYTTIISIKNEKIMTEFVNIGYQTFYAGFATNEGSWIPERTISFGIKDVYPVILKKPADWVSNLNLLKSANEFLNSDIEKLNDYIKNYNSSGSF